MTSAEVLPGFFCSSPSTWAYDSKAVHGLHYWLSFGSRLSPALPVGGFLRWGLLAPFLSATPPMHCDKPIASVSNLHRKPLLTMSSLSYAIFELCCLFCAWVSKFILSQGEAFAPVDVSEHAFGFPILSTWLLRSLDLFSHYFHLWVESPTEH